MKIWKSSLVILGISFLILTSINVSAVTEQDTQSDVWHFIYPYWQTQTVGNQPNVDIKEISADIEGDEITLSMTLWPGGSYDRSGYEAAVYVMFFNTSDAYYMMSYIDAAEQQITGGMAMGFSLSGGFLPSWANVTVNNNIISATLNKTGEDTTALEFYGVAWLWEKYGTEEQYTADAWHDWVGDYEFEGDIEPDGGNGGGNGGNGDTNDDTGGTPGFELLTLLAAVTVAFILLRRKR